MSDTVVYLNNGRVLLGDDGHGGIAVVTSENNCCPSQDCYVYAAQDDDQKLNCRHLLGECGTFTKTIKWHDSSGEHRIDIRIPGDCYKFVVSGASSERPYITNPSELSPYMEINTVAYNYGEAYDKTDFPSPPCLHECMYVFVLKYKYFVWKYDIKMSSMDPDSLNDCGIGSVRLSIYSGPETIASRTLHPTSPFQLSTGAWAVRFLEEDGVQDSEGRVVNFICAGSLLASTTPVNYKNIDSAVITPLHDWKCPPESVRLDMAGYWTSPQTANCYPDIPADVSVSYTFQQKRSTTTVVMYNLCDGDDTTTVTLTGGFLSGWYWEGGPSPDSITIGLGSSYDLHLYGDCSRMPSLEGAVDEKGLVSSNPYARFIDISYTDDGTTAICRNNQGDYRDQCAPCQYLTIAVWVPYLLSKEMVSFYYSSCGCCLNYTYSPIYNETEVDPDSFYKFVKFKISYEVPNLHGTTTTVENFITVQYESHEANVDCYNFTYAVGGDSTVKIDKFPLCRKPPDDEGITNLGKIELVEATDYNGVVHPASELVEAGYFAEKKMDLLWDGSLQHLTFANHCQDFGIETSLSACTTYLCPCLSSQDFGEYATYMFCVPSHDGSNSGNEQQAPVYYGPMYRSTYDPQLGVVLFKDCCDYEHYAPEYGGWIKIKGQKIDIRKLFSHENNEICIDFSKVTVSLVIIVSITNYEPGSTPCNSKGEGETFPSSLTATVGYTGDDGNYHSNSVALFFFNGEYTGSLVNSIPCREFMNDAVSINISCPDWININGSPTPQPSPGGDFCYGALAFGIAMYGYSRSASLTLDTTQLPYYFLYDYYFTVDVMLNNVLTWSGVRPNEYPQTVYKCALSCENVSATITQPRTWVQVDLDRTNVSCIGSIELVTVGLKVSQDVHSLVIQMNGGSSDNYAQDTVTLYKERRDLLSQDRPINPRRFGFTFYRYDCTHGCDNVTIESDGWPYEMGTSNMIIDLVWQTTITITVVVDPPYPTNFETKCFPVPDSIIGTVSVNPTDPDQIVFTLVGDGLDSTHVLDSNDEIRYTATVTVESRNASVPGDEIQFYFSGSRYAGSEDDVFQHVTGTATMDQEGSGYEGTVHTVFMSGCYDSNS